MSETTIVAFLLTYLVHSTLLLGLAAMLDRVAIQNEAWRETLWKTAMIGAVLTAAVAVAAPPRPAITLRIDRVAAPAPASSSSQASMVVMPSAVASQAPAAYAPAKGLRVGEGHSGGEETGTLQETRAIPDPPPSSWSWMSTIAGLWASVAVLLLVILLVRHVHLYLVLRPRREATEAGLPGMLAELRRAGGIWRPVHVTATPTIASPLALRANEICVPERLITELAPSEQRAALAHELAHLARRDPAWQLAARLLETVFFFQPLNRVGRRRLRQCAEYRADAWAVRLLGSQLELARCLAEVARWSTPARACRIPETIAMAEGGVSLVTRVTRLLEQKPEPTLSLLPRALVSLTLVVLVSAAVPGLSLAVAQAVDTQTSDARFAFPTSNPASTPTRAIEPELEERSAAATTSSRPTAPTTSGKASQPGAAGVLPAETMSRADSPPFQPASQFSSPEPVGTLCDWTSRSDVSTRGSVDDEGASLTIAAGGCHLIVEARGQVRFLPDDSSIEAVGEGDWFAIEERRAGVRRRAEFEARHGTTTRRWLADGEEQPWDAAADAWIRDALLVMFRQSGYGAEERAERVYARGGADAILSEAALTRASTPLRHLLLVVVRRETPLRPALAERVARDAERIPSASNRAEVLRGVVDTSTPFTAAVADSIVGSALTISSSSARGSVLRAVGGRLPADVPVPPSFLQAAAGISSSTELSRVLLVLNRRGAMAATQLLALLDVAAQISSGSAKGEVLRAVASSQRLDDRTRDRFFHVLSTISSSSEREETLTSVLARHRDPATLLACIDATEHISSSTSQANVLVRIAGLPERPSAMGEAIARAARRIGSSSERERVLRATGRF